MKQSTIVALNTSSLYAKIIINAFVTLFTTRFALKALGVDSFGLYNLIIGVMVMLTFFNSSLLVSCQRFLSIAMGEKDKLKVSRVFNNSVLIHLALSVLLALILKSLDHYIFSGFLNIKPEMIDTAKKIYNIMIISTMLTILSVPYSGIINAHEDMWFFSISEITVASIKLLAAIYILFAKGDVLLKFTALNVIAISIGFAMKYIWAKYRYEESKLNIKHMRDKILFFAMLSFAGWNTLGVIAVLVRNQGVAIVLNLFFGTVINASYGIANQLNGLILVFASTLTTVFTPMIIRSKGENNTDKMIFLSTLSSKMSFFMSSFFALPVLLFTPFVLNIWLTTVPVNTVVFCRGIVITFIILQIYPGITRGIYAVGDIKWYQIVISILLISIIPFGYLFLKLNYPAYSIIIVMIIAQIFTLIATIYFAKIKMNLNQKYFYVNSVLKPFSLFIIVFLIGYLSKISLYNLNQWLQFILISFIILVLYLLLYFKLVLNKKEAQLFISLLKRIIKKGRKNEKLDPLNPR